MSSAEDDARVAKIREQVEHTRAEMAGTLRALEGKLEPGDLRAFIKGELEDFKSAANDVVATARAGLREDVLVIKDSVKRDMTEAASAARVAVKEDVDEALTAARAATIGRIEDFINQTGDTMSKARDTVVDTIRQNPIPAAMIGVGLVWMVMNRSGGNNARQIGVRQRDTGGTRNLIGRATNAARHAFEGAEHTVSDVAHDARDAIVGAGNAVGSRVGQAAHATADLAQSAGRGASELAHDAGERAVGLARQVPEQAMRLEHQAEETFFANPLAVGAVVLGVGAVIGLALPHSSIEDDFMGEARDDLFERAQGAVSSAAGAVHDLGEKAVAVSGEALSSLAGVAATS
ncbi:hypothetical protein BH09MYX1_BH09MYX1_00390 [soil metagenome]